MKTAGRVRGPQDASGKTNRWGGRRTELKIRQKGEFNILMALRLKLKKMKHWPSPI